jgi:hypothetical protein
MAICNNSINAVEKRMAVGGYEVAEVCHGASPPARQPASSSAAQPFSPQSVSPSASLSRRACRASSTLRMVNKARSGGRSVVSFQCGALLEGVCRVFSCIQLSWWTRQVPRAHATQCTIPAAADDQSEPGALKRRGRGPVRVFGKPTGCKCKDCRLRSRDG